MLLDLDDFLIVESPHERSPFCTCHIEEVLEVTIDEVFVGFRIEHLNLERHQKERERLQQDISNALGGDFIDLSRIFSPDILEADYVLPAVGLVLIFVQVVDGYLEDQLHCNIKEHIRLHEHLED